MVNVGLYIDIVVGLYIDIVVADLFIAHFFRTSGRYIGVTGLNKTVSHLCIGLRFTDLNIDIAVSGLDIRKYCRCSQVGISALNIDILLIRHAIVVHLYDRQNTLKRA
jgi:hypothetical protein